MKAAIAFWLVVGGWFPVAALCVILGIWTSDERWTETARAMFAIGIVTGCIAFGIYNLARKQ